MVEIPQHFGEEPPKLSKKLEIQQKDVQRAYTLVSALTETTMSASELTDNFTGFFNTLYPRYRTGGHLVMPYSVLPMEEEKVPQAQAILQTYFREKLEIFTPDALVLSTGREHVLKPKMMILAMHYFGFIGEKIKARDIKDREGFDGTGLLLGTIEYLRHDQQLIDDWVQGGFIKEEKSFVPPGFPRE